MKIYHFIDYDTPFIRDSIGLAIQGLDQKFDICSYSYNDLKNDNVNKDNDNIILFLEAGQTQPYHSGWDLDKFKSYFPNSKVILFCSDTEYYHMNGGNLQFGNNNIDKVDLIFECTPQSATWLESFGLKVKVIPWTISRELYYQLRKLAGENIDFSRKINDFICIINASCPYRSNMIDYIIKEGFIFSQGGDNNCSSNDIDKVYNNCLNSYINIGTTSHNRPELNELGTMKGWRDAVGIALNCLLIYDDHPNVQKVWNIGESLQQYEFGKFDQIIDILTYYQLHNFKCNANKKYVEDLKQQQKWLERHLLDDMFFEEIMKYA